MINTLFQPEHIWMCHCCLAIFVDHVSMVVMLQTGVFPRLWHMRICSHDYHSFSIFSFSFDLHLKWGLGIWSLIRLINWGIWHMVWHNPLHIDCPFLLFLVNWGTLVYAMMTCFFMPTIQPRVPHFIAKWKNKLPSRLNAFLQLCYTMLLSCNKPCYWYLVM